MNPKIIVIVDDHPQITRFVKREVERAFVRHIWKPSIFVFHDGAEAMTAIRALAAHKLPDIRLLTTISDAR